MLAFLKAAGWTDEALYDAISVCALFNFYNKWIDATGVSDMPAAAYMGSARTKSSVCVGREDWGRCIALASTYP